jgi:hypothetical protein
LLPLGTRLLADDHGTMCNRELMHVYLLVDDRPLADFPLNAAHVGGLIDIAVADLLAVLSDPSVLVDCDARGLDRRVARRVVSQADLVPAVDGYFTVVAVMAERFVNGLAIAV